MTIAAVKTNYIQSIKKTFRHTIKSVKFSKVHNSSKLLTDKQTLESIINQYGSEQIYHVLVKKFMKKLQQEKQYNSYDKLIDEAINETEKLYNRLNVRIPII